MKKLKSLITKTSLLAISVLFVGLIAVPNAFAATGWGTIGVRGFSPDQAGDISLAFNNNTPYVAYKDVSQSKKSAL